MNKNFYVTTPIYYPNDKPHVGTAYTTIIADVIARYKKIEGFDVKFVTGTDEHGQKIEQTAISKNITPKEWVDIMSLEFKKMWELLNINYTDFVRTTDLKHEEIVAKILKKSYDNGDIYKGEYKGLYSVSEETFVSETDLIDGKYMGKPVIEVSEPAYFFKLSKYEDRLLKFLEENKEFIQPENRRNEVISFIKQGLKDLSISRTTFKWGIPLEFEEGHIVYVWFDALNSYLTGAGFETEVFDKYWNNSFVVHTLGKDILRFHSIIWLAILMSADIKLPDRLVVHGWWTVEGEKMSKSLGNVIDPINEVKEYGVDVFRYFLMREGSFNQDSDYSKKALIQRINSDLANDLGNLLNRTLAMTKKYIDGKFENIIIVENDIDKKLYSLYQDILLEVQNNYDKFNYSEVLKSIWKYISSLNKYIDENEIWNLAKDENNKERLKNTLYRLLDGLYKVSYLIYPFMPETAVKINRQLGLNDNYEKMLDSTIFKEINSYPKNIEIGESYVLFPRVEMKEEEFKKDLKIENSINIEDFNKIDIKVCEILKVENIENTSFLRIIVDTGVEKRQIISNIGKTYKNIEEIVGKKVLTILNLDPIEIKGYISQGMILTTNEKKKNTLIEVDKNVKNGVKIK